MRNFVRAGSVTITFEIDACGTFHIDAVAYHGCNTYEVNTSLGHEVVQRMLVMDNLPRIRNIKPSELCPNITDILARYKRASRFIENAVLSPYTYIGRKRLEREFELFVDVTV